MQTQSQYEYNEKLRFLKEANAIDKGPLTDRKEGKQNLSDTVNYNLNTFLERCRWLIDGSYGAGAYHTFKSLTKRMNRRAWIFNTVAVLEYRTSYKFACDVWNSLDTDLQAAVNRYLDEMIEEADKDQE